MPTPNIRLALLLAAALAPLAAHASYGGGGSCGKDFGCHFLFWGLVLGVSGGIPVSAVVFAAVHWVSCHPDRSKSKQAALGFFVGIVAFGVSAACATLMAMWGKNPWLGLFGVSVALALVSARYARSEPRGEGDRPG